MSPHDPRPRPDDDRPRPGRTPDDADDGGKDGKDGQVGIIPGEIGTDDPADPRFPGNQPDLA